MVKDIFADTTEPTRQSVLAAAKWRDMSDAEKQVSGLSGFRLVIVAHKSSYRSLILPKQTARKVSTRPSARYMTSSSCLQITPPPPSW